MTHNNDKNENIEQLTKTMSEKLNIDIDPMRKISAAEIIYLLDRWPFLQIVFDTAAEKQTVHSITANSGWTILDYDIALCSSPGQLGFSESTNEKINPKHGTMVKQAFDTATQMVEIAAKRGAKVIHVEGHPIMLRAAWIKAESLGLQVVGFEPSKEDYLVRSLVQRSGSELDHLRQDMQLNQS